jgi:GntR family transcriptional regulator
MLSSGGWSAAVWGVFAMEVSSKSRSLGREPLYHQVYVFLMSQIASGTWKPRASLPNETDLALQLGVSTGTIRKALDKLAADQIVVRRQGRGTFVVDQTQPEATSRFELLRQRNGERVVSRTELLQSSSGDPTQLEQERLQIPADQPVVRKRRRLSTLGRSLMVEDACLATSRLPGLEPNDVGDWSITALAQQHGVHLLRASEKVSVEAASPEIADLLHVQPETMVLRLDRIVSATGDAPIEWRIGFCHLQDEYYLANVN